MRRLISLTASQILVFAMAASACADAALFAGDDLLEVELRGPVSDTVRDKRRQEERAFTIVVDGEEMPVDVQTRGNSRLRWCRFPPLRLQFDATAGSSPLFAGLNKVKLVTHCVDRPANDDNLLEEYAAYRILGMLTDFSHRVRLMRIRYVDTDRPDRAPLEKLAFAIEPVETVAARTGAQVAEIEHIVKRELDREQAALVFVFQYLIANRDWSLVTAEGDAVCCHNGVLLDADGRKYIVPYDFDLSGFVFPRYARRAANLAVPVSRKRQYTEYCFDDMPFAEVIAGIVTREDEILALVDALDWTEAQEVEARRAFLESFFVEARSGELAENLADRCSGE